MTGKAPSNRHAASKLGAFAADYPSESADRWEAPRYAEFSASADKGHLQSSRH